MARRPPSPPIAVAVDRFEIGGASGLDAEGRRWVVRGAPVGAVIAARRSRKGTARMVGVVESAADAVEPVCPVFGVCGGCTGQAMPLGVQRREKQALVERSVGSPSAPIVGTRAGYGTRNKIELSFGTERFVSDAELRANPDAPRVGDFLGFHPAGWFGRIVPLTGCPLASAAMNRVVLVLSALQLRPAWNTVDHTGLWRHVVLRQGDDGVLVTLVTAPSGGASDQAVRDVGKALGALTEVSGVVWVETGRVAEVAAGGVREVLHGRPTLVITVLGRTVELPWDAFFQVTTEGAEILFGVVAEALGVKDGAPVAGTLLDLYCGTGAIGLLLGNRFDRVVGVELVEGAVVAARAMALRLGVHGEWHAGSVEALLPSLLRGEDLGALRVVVDPPRAGLHPKAASALAALRADMLVVVSCNVGSLGRDRGLLEAGGWRLDGLWSVDLFPQTPHVEAVARFVR